MDITHGSEINRLVGKWINERSDVLLLIIKSFMELVYEEGYRIVKIPEVKRPNTMMPDPNFESKVNSMVNEIIVEIKGDKKKVKE